LGKTKELEGLIVDVDIRVLDEVSASEVMLLKSHFSELIKEVLMQVDQGKG
jgi:hypothetical protein